MVTQHRCVRSKENDSNNNNVIFNDDSSNNNDSHNNSNYNNNNNNNNAVVIISIIMIITAIFYHIIIDSLHTTFSFFHIILFSSKVSDDHDGKEKIVSLSSVVITDIDTVAQILKMVLRDLPEPVITFATFESMMNICVQFEVNKKCIIIK